MARDPHALERFKLEAKAASALRGKAFLLNHQPKEAEVECQSAMKLQNEGFQSPSAWLAQLYLARAYAMEGDAAKERATYQDFFVTWKDADPACPCWPPPKPSTPSFSRTCTNA